MPKKEKVKSTIQRKKHNRKFLVLGNELLQREDIGYAELGLLVSLLSRPDDWIVVVSQLERDGTRRDKIAKMIKRLRELGYITKGDQSRSFGKWSSAKYYVSEEPSPCPEIPSTVAPSSVLPSTVKPQQQRTYLPSDEKTDPTPHPHKETTTTKTGSSLSLDILGKDDLEKWVRIKGQERVDLVCQHSRLKAKDSPNGWAVVALRDDWHLAEIALPEKYVYDSAEFFYHQHLMETGLSEEQADRYFSKYPHTWLYTGKNGRRDSQDDLPELSQMLELLES